MIEEICGTCKFNLYDKKEIEDIPVAYDVDAVVEELENRASLRNKGVDERYNSYIKTADVYRQATLIMKGDVKDESNTMPR